MKKFITGAVLGGLGALAAWKAMDEKKRRALQEKVQKKVREGEDYLTEYALTSLDTLDGMVGDYGPAAAEKLRGLKATVKDQLKSGDAQLDRKAFDQQTADLREALKEAKDDEAKGHDIVIDQTADAAQEPAAPKEAPAKKAAQGKEESASAENDQDEKKAAAEKKTAEKTEK